MRVLYVFSSSSHQSGWSLLSAGCVSKENMLLYFFLFFQDNMKGALLTHGLVVRPAERALRQELERVLENKAGEIDRILADYGVPRLPIPIGDSLDPRP